MTFAELLKKLREQAQMTQRALAEATGLSLSAITQMEQGLRGASLDTARKLAKALGVDVNTLAVYDMDTAQKQQGKLPSRSKGKKK
jgi:transcriptional regulator with XRE-family HTH domain